VRSGLIKVAGGIATVLYAVAVILHMLVFRDRDVFYRYARAWSRLLLRLGPIHLSVTGLEHLQPGQRYVYAVNHVTMLDIPIVLAAVPDNIRIMYKQELENVPVFGWALKLSPFIALNRERTRSAADAVASTVHTMSSGTSVLVFPEGQRSYDGTLGTFRRGAVMLAVRSHTPVVPVTLRHAETIMHGSRIVGGSVDVVIHPAMSVDHVRTTADEKAFTEQIRQIVASSL